MSPAPDSLLTSLLRDVSRSFYLTLRVLPGRIRSPIGLAYLLARATDTVADTELLPVEQRLQALARLRERILGLGARPLDFGELAQRQGSAPERVLLERAEEALTVLESQQPADRELIRQVLTTITSGQELDLRRFAGASPEHIVALRTEEELVDYTYRVAGCVGEFWTRMCRAHLFPRAKLDDRLLLSNGVRFGQGLQLVNILRDLPADLRQGRCYLPSERLAAAGLKPQDLMAAANEPRLRPLYDQYLDVAEGHLQAGWTYTNTLPWSSVRVRLACAWPVLIGLDTLKLLRQSPILDPQHRVKVSRRQVRRRVLASVICYPLPGAWRGLAGPGD
jgi:farnesyl-diphosphate farnesyltransferase